MRMQPIATARTPQRPTTILVCEIPNQNHAISLLRMRQQGDPSHLPLTRRVRTVDNCREMSRRRDVARPTLTHRIPLCAGVPNGIAHAAWGWRLRRLYCEGALSSAQGGRTRRIDSIHRGHNQRGPLMRAPLVVASPSGRSSNSQVESDSATGVRANPVTPYRRVLNDASLGCECSRRDTRVRRLHTLVSRLTTTTDSQRGGRTRRTQRHRQPNPGSCPHRPATAQQSLCPPTGTRSSGRQARPLRL